MPNPEWFFPELNGGEESGLNEPGIQSFKHVDSLARETVQNILDHPDDSGQPRIAEFELIDLPRSEFPGAEQFTSIFKACRDFVLPQLEGKKVGNEKAFFDEGLRALAAPTLPVLRIGDRNTTGLEGSDLERNKPFYRLLRGQGFSTSEGKGGGTYGIGQRAPFAYSALRAVLYSTQVRGGSRAFVAKAILSSHRAPNGQHALCQAKGWWGIRVLADEAWRAIRTESQIPERFRRTAVGTDLYVMGFVQNHDWDRRVRHSVLKHFFAAIDAGDLVVRIMKNGDDLSQIDKTNLERELVRAAEEARTTERSDEWRTGLLASLYYYKALHSPVNNRPFENVIDRLGACRLFVFRDQRDNATPQTWCTMRAPRMLIAQHGSQLLDHYAAVFVCDTEDGNDYLARLEDLTHTRWHQDELRNCNDDERATARRVLGEIRTFVRNTLKEIGGFGSDTPQDVPLLGDYLPSDADEDATSEGPGTPATGSPPSDEPSLEGVRPNDAHGLEAIEGTSNAPAIHVQQLQPTGTEAGGRRSHEHGNGRGPKRKRRPGNAGPGQDGTSGDETQSVLSSDEVQFRSYVDGDWYVVILHPDATVTGTLRLVAVGERGLETPVSLAAAESADGRALSVSGSDVHEVALDAGQTCRLRVRLAAGLGQELCLGLGS